MLSPDLEGLRAVAGKYHRHINGILTNWRKNNLRTVQEITAHETASAIKTGRTHL